ncbi:hypothetical protein N8I77_003158 [Diaporthe amygdali]|uniref:BTB domain-containing protein n=1 Tax=Phomopsis amygdali TaxID=1214568 RepID=A0AAD9W6H2_PHOAM|nr:hypothetical protein N8I77_003158 [Diaporthe amygdali]
MASPNDNWVWSSADGLHGQYLELLETGLLSDAEVRCGKRAWKVHKAILCVKSEWFKMALTGPFEEAELSVVNITEFEENEVDCLLCFIYTGKINVEKFFPGKARLTASIPIWKMGDFFSLEDLCKVAIEGRDAFFRSVSDIIYLVKEVYKEERGDIRKAFIPPLLALLLSGLRFLAKTDEFKDLLRDMPAFALDWAMTLTNGIGSVQMPKSCRQKCAKCNKWGSTGINHVKWIKQRKLKSLCPQCFPVQRLEDWVGESSEST